MYFQRKTKSEKFQLILDFESQILVDSQNKIISFEDVNFILYSCLRTLATHITINFSPTTIWQHFFYRFQKGRLVLTFAAMWSLSVRTKPLFVANRMGVALPWAQFHIRLLVWSEIRSWLTPFLWLVSTLCTGYFMRFLFTFVKLFVDKNVTLGLKKIIN